MAGWKTIELMNQAGNAIGDLGGALKERRARMAADEAARVQKASDDAFKKKVAPLLDLPTEAPAVPTDWRDKLMNQSRLSAEASGKQYAADHQMAPKVAANNQALQKAQGVAPSHLPPDWKDQITRDLKFDTGTMNRLNTEAAAARTGAGKAVDPAGLQKAQTDFNEKQSGFDIYNKLDPNRTDDLLKLMEKARAEGGKGIGGSPYSDEKEARQWLESAYQKIWAVSGLPAGPLQNTQYQTYAEAMAVYRQLRGLSPKEFPTPTLEELNKMTADERKSLWQVLGSVLSKGSGQ